MQNIIVPEEYKKTFDTLNGARQTVHIYQEMSLWPEWAPGTEVAASAHDFWKLSDILVTVNGINTDPYRSTITLDNIIREYTPKKLKEKNPARMSRLAASHFHVLDGDEFDAELSRFAAWALVKEIGKQHPTTFHQEYFINPNAGILDIYSNTNETARIGLREVVSKYQKQLDGIMKRLRANNGIQYADMKREMYTWLFKSSATDIKKKNHLPENKPLADFMNAYLLRAYIRALRNIIAKWDNGTVRDYSGLRGAIYNEMVAARESLTKKFARPENSIKPNSVAQVEQWRKNREFQFARNYINVYVK